MVATNLLFLSSSEKNLNEFPIYFGSTRGTFGDLNEAAELGQLILSNEQTSKNTHTVMGSWVGSKDISNNNYILSPDRYLITKLTLIDQFNKNILRLR